MSVLVWILLSGLLMSCVALVGGITLILREDLWKMSILPLIAFAAGSLIGGATFHMIPSAVDKMGNGLKVYIWLNAGFLVFFALEEFLHWHHSHTHTHRRRSHSHDHQHPRLPLTSLGGCEPSPTKCTSSASTKDETNSKKESYNEDGVEVEDHNHSKHGSNIAIEFASDLGLRQQTQLQSQISNTEPPFSPLNWLILVADGLHNILGGMFVAASFLDSIELGWSAWLAAAAHELPQELGDFAILVHGGWSKKKALLFNFISALTFPLGGLVAYAVSKVIDVSFLVPFAAGNFLYIGASDIIPEIKHHHGPKQSVIHFISFSAGLVILMAIRVALVGW